VLTGGAIPENGTRRGFGMTAIDFKWRFAESGAWSVGTRAGLDLPTAASGLGFDSPGGHALLVATGIFDRGIFTANLAWTRLPAGAGPKPDLYRVSAGGYASVTDHLRLAGDLAYYSVEADNGTQWAAVAVVGAIYTIVKDLDVDVGWQPRLKQPAPSNVLLFGLTVRW